MFGINYYKVCSINFYLTFYLCIFFEYISNLEKNEKYKITMYKKKITNNVIFINLAIFNLFESVSLAFNDKLK